MGYVYIHLSLGPSFFCTSIEDIFVSSYANDGWFVIVLYVFVLQINLCTKHKFGLKDFQFTCMDAMFF